MKRFCKFVFKLLPDTEAAALLEFAVALPLLVVLVVGIFDFGGAFNLKQELNNAAREGARFGSIQPTNDLYPVGQAPASVNAIRFAVDAYLKKVHINDCGLDTLALPTSGGNVPTWNFNASTGCAAQTLQLTINRGFTVQELSAGNPVNVICTQISLSYPYQWHFNNVIQLLVPGAHLGLVNIQTEATAVNTD